MNNELKRIQKETERRGRVVKILLRIREVPGSNLGPETIYLQRFFVVFLSPTRRM
jgi:hypothetical protein